jgi:osmotically-inducible protein OsmY
VTLRGMMGSRAEAAAAIRTTLDTQGVDQVTSYLTWPNSM